MLTSARMKKIEILTLVADEPKVTETVGELGVLHLTKAPAEGGALPVEGPESRENQSHVEELEARAGALCDALGIGAAEPPASIPYSALYELERDLNRIESEVSEIAAARETLSAHRSKVEKLLRDTSILRDIDAPVEQLEDMSFLHFAIGGMTGGGASAAEQELGDRAVVLPYKTPYGDSKVVAISSKKGRWALESALEKHGFKRDGLPTDEKGVPSRIAELAEQRLEQLLERTRENNQAIRAAAEQHGEQLRAIRRRLQTERRIVKARENFAHTWATMLITGWVPEEKLNALCETVLDITRQRAIIEVRDPLAEDGPPPTMMKNPSIFRPFEVLVSAYSTPRYNEIDPTPFLAILFLLMFGMMFGDVGHSAILFITGLIVWRKARARVRDFGIILTWCGVSGVIFGLVYGSFFGIEFRGVDLMGSVESLLQITVLFGAGVITIGLILNIINRLRRREYLHAWFDKFGIVGALFYVGSLTLTIRAAVGGRVGWLPVVLLVVAPVGLLVVYRPVVFLLRKWRGRPPEGENFFLVVFESVIEAFEAVLLYMANTLSFARLAAFALAHAGLSLAIFEIMDMVQGLPGGPVWAAIVFILGTLVILLLEGLIVAIQSMRLQYYEFFSKFFQGDGRRYEPFSLKAR